MIMTGVFDPVRAELDSVTIPTATPEAMQLENMLGSRTIRSENRLDARTPKGGPGAVAHRMPTADETAAGVPRAHLDQLKVY